jgi:hypothetical protein
MLTPVLIPTLTPTFTSLTLLPWHSFGPKLVSLHKVWIRLRVVNLDHLPQLVNSSCVAFRVGNDIFYRLQHVVPIATCCLLPPRGPLGNKFPPMTT